MKLFTRNGKLWIDFYHQSKRVRKSLGLDDTKKNRKLAESQIVPELIYKLNNGAEFFENQEKPKKSVLFRDFAKKSFEINSNSRKKSTRQDYEISLRLHIMPFFGDMRIDKIKASDVALWQNNLLSKVRPRRVRNVRATLHTIFEDALRDELISRNPLSLVRTPKLDKVEPKSFSMDEMRIILENAEGDLKNFCALGFFTGMRSGEMIGLRWEDVDFNRREISIKRAIRMGEISTPKTQSSIRTIDIIDNLVPYLQNQFSITGEANSFVFLNKDGENYYDIKNIRNSMWKHLLKKCGIEYRPIYQLRHTFATLMVENGEDVLWVANMLGHSDPSMTLTKYAKYQKRDNKKRATFLGEL
ncbi:MAG: tyrosine-type recombinase/integrase [Campylobacterales bacterium]